MDRRPAVPVAVDVDATRYHVDQFGVKYQAYEQVYTEYDVGRIRAGYCCINCGEAQEQPWPEKCFICAFPMKRDQAQRFSEEFVGYTTVGPSKSMEELRAEDEEAKARAAHAKAKPTTSIWLPS